MQLAEMNRRKLRYKNGQLRIPHTCEITFTNKNGEVTARGRTFEVEKGTRLDLFPVGVLCKMLDRNHRTIYRWEKNHGFPAAMWRVKEFPGCNRWYSRAQLEAIVNVYDYFGRLSGKKRNKLGTFVSAVRSLFFTVDMPEKKREA